MINVGDQPSFRNIKLGTVGPYGYLYFFNRTHGLMKNLQPLAIIALFVGSIFALVDHHWQHLAQPLTQLSNLVR